MHPNGTLIVQLQFNVDVTIFIKLFLIAYCFFGYNFQGLISLCCLVAFKSREDHRKQLELEEARKAGLAPAEVDEDGKEINPHIPQYMSSAPWYLNAERPVCNVFIIFGALFTFHC